jgi:hypothetical protein
MDIFEGVKTVGAFVGLITGVFVVIDRIFRHRPIVYLRPDHDPDYLMIVVRNIAKEAIIIKSITCDPPSMLVGYGLEIEHMVEAAADKKFSTVIEPASEKAFVWMSKPEWDKEAGNKKTVITIHWAFTRSRWLVQFPVRVRNTVDFLKMLRRKESMRSGVS